MLTLLIKGLQNILNKLSNYLEFRLKGIKYAIHNLSHVKIS